MKKYLLILLTVLLGLGTWQSSAQQLVEILGDGGTTTSSYLPAYTLYNNTLSEQIYTAQEVGMGGVVSSIAFYNGGTTKSPNIKIYMVNTTKTEFTSTTDWMTVTAADLVFEGDVTFTAGAWTTIQLSTPFTYDGVSNLGLIVDEYMSWSSGLECRVFTSTSNCAMYVYSDGTNYDAVGATYSASSRLSVKNQIKLEIQPANVNCHSVGTLSVSGITSYAATISWGIPEDGGSYILQYKTSDLSWDDSGVMTVYPTDTTYQLDNLTPITNYNVRVANLCNGTDTSYWRNTSFTTACAPIDQLPYTENFDTYGTGSTSYPTCWTKLSTATGNNCPYVSSTNYAGSGSLYFYTGTASTYQIAILPSIDPSIPINTLQLSFVYRANSNSDRLVIGVMDDITDAATFTPVDTVYPLYSAPSAWERRVVSLANYAGTGSYIAIRNEHTGNNAYAYIDNVEVDVIANCQVPSDLSITNYTSEGADIDWTSNGNESAWEVVAVAANADVNTGTPVPASTHPFTLTGLQDNTTYDVYVRSDCGSGEYSEWSIKRTFKTNPSCSAPLNVSVAQVTTNSALVTWDDALFGANSYTVGYSQDSLNNWTTQTVTGATQCMISGLTLDMGYDVFVVSNCAEGTADTVFTSFSTKSCMAGGDPFTEGTSTHSNLPLNNYYNYTYTQQIFLASEMGGAHTLDSIAFDYAYSTPSTEKASVTIYLGHTTQSTFSSTSNYIPATGLQQVYTGNLNCTQGWNTFVFSTPFQYNGTDNLVLVVDDNSGDYNGSGYYFHVHDAGAPRALYFYDDNINPDLSDPTFDEPNSGTTSSRSNVKFFIPCDNTLTCVAPNPYVTEATDNSVTVAWAPGSNETSWELEYTTDSVWVSEGTVSNPHTISGLSDNTDVRIRVRSVCGGSETSGWAGTSARTACSVVNILPLTENFDDVENTGSDNRIYCWSTGSNYSSSYPSLSSSQHNSGGYSVYFYGTSAYYSYLASPEFDASIPVNGLQVRFWAYKTSTPYYIQVGVMSDPNDYSTFEQVGGDITPDATGTWQLKTVNLDQYSGNGHYVAFRVPQSYSSFIYIDDIAIDVIPSCEHVDSLQVSNVTPSGATVAWVPGGNESAWDIAFVPGTGAVDMDTVTFTTVNGTPEYTANDLSQNTPYTVYVRANCGSETSFWMNTMFMTMQVPGTLPYFCDFEDAEVASAFAYVNGNQPHKWHVGTATNNGGTHALYISADNGATSSYNTGSPSTVWAYRDIEFPATPSGYILSFDWRCYGEGGYDFMNVYVGAPAIVTAGVPSSLYSGNLANPAGTIALQTTANSSYPHYFNLKDNYQTYTTTLPGLAEPTVQRIYFLWRNDGSSGDMPPAAVDNISVSAIYCDAPTALALDTVTTTSATISWNTDAASSLVAYKADNEADWTEIPSATSPYELTNLLPNTSYTVRVAANCEDGVNTSPYITLSFFTECGAVTNLPYTENFDSYASGSSSRPNCWSFPITYNSTPYITSSYSAASSPNSLYFMSLTTTPTTAVTPAFDADIHTLRVKFMLRAESTTSSGTFEVGVMSDPADVTTFESVRIIQPANTEWTQYAVNFDSTALSGGNLYIAFRQNSNSSSWYYWLDNVSVSTIPSCNEPANLTANVTTTDAELHWTEVPGESTYEVYVYPSNQTPDYTQAVTVTTNSYLLSTLESDVSYTAMVRTVCSSGDGYSDWSVISFSLLNSEPAQVPYAHAFDDGEENAAWTIVNGTQTNKWYIGQPSGESDSVLFISNNGTSEAYNTSNTSNVWAYRDFAFGEGAEFELDIKWKGTGESCCDYLRVFIGSPSDVTAGSTDAPSGAVQLAEKLNQQSNWQHFTAVFNGSYANSTKRLYLLWHNDSSVGTSPAAVVDSIVITVSTCGRPYDLAVDNVQPFSADFTFSPAMPTDGAWEYAICTNGETADIAAISGLTSTTTFTVSTLTQETAYTAYVRTACADGSNSAWSNPIAFVTPPTCPAVTNVSVTAVTATSVTLDWTPGGSEGSWEIAYGEGAVDPATATVVTAATHPYEVQNLTDATAYQFYVRAVCDATDHSSWSPAVGAATPCGGALALPYSENFDGYVANSSSSSYPSDYPNDILPSCWSFLNRSTNSDEYPMAFLTTNSGYAVSGNCLFFRSSASTPLYAVLPEFTDNLQSQVLTFTYRNEGVSTSNGTLSVGYMTDPADANSFVEVDTFPQTTTLTTDTVEFATVPATANNARIVFKYTGGQYNNYYLSLDNINVTLAGSGPVITDPTVATNAASALGQTTATLNATITNPDNVTITAKGFQWKATQGGTYTTVNGTGTGNNFTAALSNLTPNTQYTFKAFITFNGQTVTGNEMTFTTQNQDVEPCDVPTGVTVSAVTDESITITWNNAAGVNSWNIQYRPVGGTLSSATSNTNSYTINGLQPETTYEIQVQANCGGGNLSEWSSAVTGTTTVGIDSWLANSVSLYPNPAKEVVNVQCTMNNVQLTGELSVFDVYGKLLQIVPITSEITPINVSGLANGMYFVRVVTEEGMVTKTFVKK